ncbi:MAG: hypothetical protein EHM19_09755 [Candidatus Latescibacterota bacterium]|nr:MAG: hypothetical protein EHM19_09755 [Candidatus Latescibacterota bacterium]
MRRTVPAALLLACLAIGVASPARSATKLEGEYQLQLDIRKQDRFFPWDFESNNNDTYAASQFRLFSQPRTGVEAFVKYEADWYTGGNENERPLFHYRESHVRFARPLGPMTGEAYLFSRQNRFWVDNHLIRVVDPEQVKDGDNAQGIRFNLKTPSNVDVFTYIMSDFSSQSRVGGGAAPTATDDAHILRWRPVLRENFRLGATYNRKVIGPASDIDYNEVWALDGRWTFRNTDFYLEFASAKQKGVNKADADGFHFGDWEIDRFAAALPRNAAVKAELRAITFGTPSLGYYNIAPLYYYFGPDFSDFLGESTSDLVGWKMNTWYLLPRRAITFTFDYEEWEKYVYEVKTFSRWRVEVYTEYVNGFTSKIWYDRKKTVDNSNPLAEEVTKNYDLFGEVQVESRLAWMRVQGKLKDLETNFKKELVSLEAAVNITDRLKLYSRYAFGNDPARLRKGLFTELQYRPQRNMDLYLSYGPFWIGDSNNPVDDGDLAGGADNKDMIRLIVKGNF